ncbi:MAG: ribosomal protein L7/L12, partial [Acidobacteriota bacterium]
MQFQVIFESAGSNTQEEKALIKEKLIEKFKVAPEKAERMVNSTPIVVKKGLTQEQAEKYKAALESIGAQASISVLEEGKSEIEQRQDITPQDNRENVYTTATKLVNQS